MSHRYILNGEGKPMLEPDLMTWAQWYQTAERHVADTNVENVRISTVFLGLDHNYGWPGPPVLYETMIFDAEGEEFDTIRYCTKEEALVGHERQVRKVRAALEAR